MTDTLQIAVFDKVGPARRAIQQLLARDFARDTISVVTSRDRTVDPRVDEIEPSGSHTLEAASAGGALGAVLGGAVAATAVVAGGGTGLLVIGPLLGGSAAGALGGGFLGAMATRGVEPEVADYYDQALQKGQVLVAVEAPAGRAQEAAVVLEEAGAVARELPAD